MNASVSVQVVQKNDRPYLQFDFTGHLDEATAIDAILKWKKEVANLQPGRSKVDLIYNCISMSGFDTGARKKWQEAMKELQPYTDVIWIVSDNIFIIGAAKTMGVLTRYTIKAVRSLDEVRK
jgi:hypothetical protein